jgi:F0F1-type ATP synthase delta subunit
MLESDRELRDFFARPWTPPTVKRTVAMEVAQRSDLSKLASDFMSLVAGRGRTDYIEAIAARYEKLVDEHLGRVRARAFAPRCPSPTRGAGRSLRKSDRRLGAGRYCSRRSSIPRCSAVSSWRAAASLLDGSLEGQLERIRRRLMSA